MPYFFFYGTDYTFLPEFLSRNSMPIYLLYRVETEVKEKYGNLEVKALYSGKTERRSSWPSFLTEVANLSDTYKNLDNKLWVLGTRGS